MLWAQGDAVVGMVAHTFGPGAWRQRHEDLCECKDILVCAASSRPAGATILRICLKNKPCPSYTQQEKGCGVSNKENGYIRCDC